MRAATTKLGLVLFALSLFVPVAGAQFDDEFDDEFDREAESTDTPAETATNPDDEFGAEFDDNEVPPSTEDVDSDIDEATDESPVDLDAAAARRARGMRAHNSWYGSTGGLRTVDAGGAATGSFRVSLMAEFFVKNGFLAPEDGATHVGGSLSINGSIHDNIEIWGSLQSFANSNDFSDPQLFQVLGDAQLGIKAFYGVTPWLTIGGDVSLSLLNTIGDIGLVFKSTSVGIRLNASADLRELESSIPLIVRFNAQYYIDNSSKLIEDVEQARFDNLPDPAPIMIEEDRHLITTAERFGLNINRTDFFNIGLGVEVPLNVTGEFYLHPLLEWNLGIPVNRQGYSCLFLPSEPGSDEPAEGTDGCLDKQGLSAFPMTLTIGARILPAVKGLSFTLAADIGLTGKSVFVRDIAPNMPWNIIFGAQYAYDTVTPPTPEPEVREVEKVVEVAADIPVTGRVRGLVIEQGTTTPIAGAKVEFPGKELTALLTGDDGKFTTYKFAPGEVRFGLTHPEYNAGECVATVPEEAPEEGELIVDVRCELAALPRVGTVNGKVTGDAGAAVAGAKLTVTGPTAKDVTSSADGSFKLEGLTPGTYTAKVEAVDHLIKLQQFEVKARETATPEITLIPRPKRALVLVRKTSIKIRRKINFATDSAEILPTSEPLMTEIADVLLRNPEIKLVEIQGHTDDKGGRAHNLDLSRRRAESVRAWLIGGGVDGSRMQAAGFGPDKPLVPNLTAANRARNRRVQFSIKERDVAAPAAK